jgi:AraC-like DNA-binding protein
MIAGSAVIYCNYAPLQASVGDVVLINKDELHYLENLSGPLRYRIVKIDFSCLAKNGLDDCTVQYIEPLLQNRLRFVNGIRRDGELCRCIDRMAREYSEKRDGYELAFRGCLYDLLSILVRSYAREPSQEKETERVLQTTRQFGEVIEYIERNYGEKITLKTLATMAHMSPAHFCRVFKKLTGRTAVDYVNRIRVEKAYELLSRGGCNVTEAAVSAGFSDTNYFSRTFKKYKHVAPSGVIGRAL